MEYSVIGNDALYIWVVKPTGEVVFQKVDLTKQPLTLPTLVQTVRCFDEDYCQEYVIAKNTRSEQTRSFEEVVTQVATRLPDQSPPPPVKSPHLKQLHNLLIAPIAQHLPTDPNQRVIFVPQGELFLVPFPALLDAQDKYLVEKHTILTAPAIAVLQLTRSQRQRLAGATGRSVFQNALVVGNPEPMPGGWSQLEGSATEAIAIGQLLNATPLVGRQATKAEVIRRIEQASLVHLATHGYADSNQGLQSWVALAASGKDGGFLTADEFLDLKLQAQLVVLSACETGKGKITGDGVIGLSRSLISAGAPSVLVSLWKVNDDSTNLLMQEFYRNRFQKRMDKAQALRQAMLTTMQQKQRYNPSEKYDNPMYWAAFTLIGEAE